MRTRVQLDIIEVEGRTFEAVKILGMVPESVEADDYSLYVRWHADGSVTADRSDTDRWIARAHVGSKGKLAAFVQLMESVATFYGVPVEVSMDPGVSGAQAAKMVGTYLPREVNGVRQAQPVATQPTAQQAWDAHYAVATDSDPEVSNSDSAPYRASLAAFLTAFATEYPDMDVTGAHEAMCAGDNDVAWMVEQWRANLAWQATIKRGEAVYAATYAARVAAGDSDRHADYAACVAEAAITGAAVGSPESFGIFDTADRVTEALGTTAPVDPCAYCGRADSPRRDDIVKPFPHECASKAEIDRLIGLGTAEIHEHTPDSDVDRGSGREYARCACGQGIIRTAVGKPVGPWRLRDESTNLAPREIVPFKSQAMKRYDEGRAEISANLERMHRDDVLASLATIASTEPMSLPVESKADAFTLVESAIWAGTGTLLKPVRTKLAKRARKSARRARRGIKGGF